MQNAYDNNGLQTPGHVALVLKSVAALGWDWGDVETFRRPGVPDCWWDREVRDGIQFARWTEAANERNEMHGLDAIQGTDRKAALALLQRGGGVKLGLLRSILFGIVRLQKRFFEASIVDSPMGPLLWHGR